MRHIVQEIEVASFCFENIDDMSDLSPTRNANPAINKQLANVNNKANLRALNTKTGMQNVESTKQKHPSPMQITNPNIFCSLFNFGQQELSS